MTPIEASMKKNETEANLNLYHSKQLMKLRKPKFSAGDKVHIRKYKRIFTKSCISNWSEEIFTIDKIKPTIPITYKLKDLLNEDI